MATLGATVRDGFAAPSHEQITERVKPPRSGRISRTLLVGFSLMAIGSIGLLQVFQTSYVASTGFELRTLQTTRARLESQNRLLEANIAQQSQLERIRDEAVTVLGMVQPERTLHVTVDQPAPVVVPLPRRYVEPVQLIEQDTAPPWEPLLERIPGFD